MQYVCFYMFDLNFVTTRKVVAFWSRMVARNSGLWVNVGYSVASEHSLI